MTRHQLDAVQVTAAAAADYLASPRDQPNVRRAALFDALSALVAALDNPEGVPASVSVTTTRHAIPGEPQESLL